jgi:hypothetical protein
VRAQPGVSGRLERCFPFGELRDGGYRVRRAVLDAWGEISNSNGFIGRAPYLISVGDPDCFLTWLNSQEPRLVELNN